MNNSAIVGKLIRACQDEERTLQHERRFVDVARAATLTRLAVERRDFIRVLEALGARGPRKASTSWTELVREGARDLWVAAVGRNNGDALASCRHANARIEALYTRALDRTWPAEAREILQSQRSQLRRETDELNQLGF